MMHTVMTFIKECFVMTYRKKSTFTFELPCMNNSATLAQINFPAPTAMHTLQQNGKGKKATAGVMFCD